MPSERAPQDYWRLVRQRFDEVLDLPAAEVGPWLREHERDPAIREEVASLVEHHTRAGAFLEVPAGALDELLGDDAPIPEGQQVGPYAIVREVGRGGMGRVYQAIDTRLGRRVALKALPPRLSRNPTERERLRREARALAALTHPGICSVYALEEFAGELYMVAEFVPGETLREEIARGPLPPPASVLAAARELSAALASAHAHLIAHRDLKPENVMRTPDRRLKVLDFGLARLAGQEQPAAHVTEPGTLVGTPAYMAPEQLNGGSADARSDVFALGVVLYEYACGVHPFDAPTPLARAGRVLEATPEPLGRRRADLPAWFVSAVERCLRKSPDERFQTAGDLAALLDSAESLPRPRTAAAATPEQATSMAWWCRHQSVIVLLYLVAAVLAWQVKEWRPGIANAIFIGVGIAAAVGGVLRGHLLFTARTHRAWLDRERRRLAPLTFGIDLGLAGALALDGLILSPTRAVMGVLVLGVAVGIGLARVLLEPATTRAAFDIADRA
jgi:serine/threonine protein kinase